MWDERVPVHVDRDFYGVDFSPPAIAAASEVAARARLEAEFVQANVYEAVAALDGRRFDVVYTGLGAINWLPDIERWARTMAALVAPGGRFYLAEFHPFTEVFPYESLTVTDSYFHRQPRVVNEAGTYADLKAPTVHNESVEWQHTLGDVISALIATGLQIQFLHEHDYTLFPRWPFLERGQDGS
jgi:SAM-dependent methyltransferase